MTNTRAVGRRKPQRLSYDWERAAAVLDEAPLCHVATVRDSAPVVLPMAHGRIGRDLYLHGSAAAGLFRDFRRGSPVCVCATLYDGVVLGRSARYHSMNYRSATVHGNAHPVTEPGEVEAGLRAVVEHIIARRWNEARTPTVAELRETGVWRIPVELFSVKCRQGPPIDPDDDLDLPAWAGVIPCTPVYGDPVPAPDLRTGLAAPVV